MTTKIYFGDIVLIHYPHGDIMLEHINGEGMEISAEEIESMFKQYLEENF